MLGLFKKKASNHLSLENVNYSRLPVLNADELIALTGQQGRLRSIKRIVKIDDQRYQHLYQNVIERFAELVQLMPASQAHHHAVPGGLFVHTMEVIEIALTLRQQYKLPLFSEQEVQEAERHLWTYAIFVAAMLHDIGKRLTLCRFVLEDGAILEPFSSNIEKSVGKYYRLVFHDSKYHPLHEQLGLAFVCTLLPPIAQDFLLPRLHIMKELMSYIHEAKNDDGIIGKILKEADQRSTGQSLAHSTMRKFPGANLENMGERLMTQLRSLIAANHFVINKRNASIYVSKDGYTYCVSKVLADDLRETLLADGVTDIPHDNNRIFDIFGEYGFAEQNDKGQVIHYIHREIDGSSQTLSVLKFQTMKLFRMQPESFTGQLEELANRNANPVAVNKTSEPVSETTKVVENHSFTKTEKNKPNILNDMENNKKDTEVLIIKPETTQKESAQTETGKSKDINEDEQETNLASETVSSQAFSTTETVDKPQTKKKKPKVEKENLDHIPSDFFNWCREKIKNKTIIINDSGGMIQKVTYQDRAVIAVVSPRIFTEFAAETYGWPKEKPIAEKVQSTIHNNKHNIPAKRGQLHTYHIVKSHNNPLGGYGKMFMYLFELEKIYESDTEVKAIVDAIEVNKNLAHN